MGAMAVLANGFAAVHSDEERLGVLEAQLAVADSLNSRFAGSNVGVVLDIQGVLAIQANMIPPLCELGRIDRALELSHASYAKACKIYGNTDDMTITTALNHGMLLSRIGRRTEAVKFLREQLPIAHRAFGPNHISTLKLRAVLSSALNDYDSASREDVSEAATTLNDVLRRATRTLGDSHPFTRRVKIEQRDANARAASFAPA